MFLFSYYDEIYPSLSLVRETHGLSLDCSEPGWCTSQFAREAIDWNTKFCDEFDTHRPDTIFLLLIRRIVDIMSSGL